MISGTYDLGIESDPMGLGFDPTLVAIPPHIQTAAERAADLESLPHHGFEPEQLVTVAERIAAVGLPTDNIHSLARYQNEKGREDYLGSYTTGGPDHGEYAVYELLDQQIPEKQLGTIAHESAHANSPFWTENAHLFGSESERREVATFIEQVADQSLITTKYLNGYHSYLAKQLMQGEIDMDTFREETWAITMELALTNRKKLEQVQTAQHHKMDYLIGMGQVIGRQKIDLVAPEAAASMETKGIDRALITLLSGVSNQAELINHVASLKARFYDDEALAQAYERGTVSWDSLSAPQQASIDQFFVDWTQYEQIRQDHEATRLAQEAKKKAKSRGTSLTVNKPGTRVTARSRSRSLFFSL